MVHTEIGHIISGETRELTSLCFEELRCLEIPESSSPETELTARMDTRTCLSVSTVPMTPLISETLTEEEDTTVRGLKPIIKEETVISTLVAETP